VPIRFDAALSDIGTRTILRLPEVASEALPSRGQVSVTGTLAGHAFRTVLEPDGELGHWMNVDEDLRRAAGVGPGCETTVDLEVTKEWPEPAVPEDFARALAAAPRKVRDTWDDITPMARWEWIRWVNETKNPNTRAVRIEKSMSKLNGTHRRPCCFNLAACTDPELARSGRLVAPGGRSPEGDGS
jgi:hypothetical protein